MMSSIRKLKRSYTRKLKQGQEWFERHERRISSLALVCGFVFDYLTLTRIDQVYDNLVIIFYLTLAFGSITFIHLYESWTFHKYVRSGGRLDTWFGWIHLALPTVLQFVFGGLFSAFVIFYSRSATFGGSWPFLLALIALLIGNEFFRRQYIRLSFQVSIFFFAVYSYAIFGIPILVGTIDQWVFLLSGVVTIIVIWGFLYLLSRVIPTRYKQSKRTMLVSIGAIFVVINVSYFTGVIPPIPLSLQDAGVYYHVDRLDTGNYSALRAKKEWYEWYQNFEPYPPVEVRSRDVIYVFSAVFAPTDLYADVVHEWQYYNENTNKWITSNTEALPVIGGREGGFRLYSFHTMKTSGYWRVNIETLDGRVIGRVPFKVEVVTEEPETERVIL